MAVSKKDRWLVIRYYLAAVLGLRAQWLILLLSAEWLLLCMLDDIVFHNPNSPYMIGMAVWLVLVAALTALICYAILAERIGLGRAAWASVEEKALRSRRAARDRGDNSPIAHFPDAKPGQRASLAYSARRAAILLGIKVPKPGACVLAMFLSCTLFLAALYAVHFADCANLTRQEQQTAAQTFYTIEDAFERSGLYALGFDPMDTYSEHGYLITGKIEDQYSDGSCVRMTVGNDGAVHAVMYALVTDQDKSMRENLNRAEKYFERLHNVVKRLDVEFAVPDLVSFDALPEEFKEKYLDGSPYERIHMTVSDLKGEGGADISCSYFTYSEEEYEKNDYFEPEIYISIEA